MNNEEIKKYALFYHSIGLNVLPWKFSGDDKFPLMGEGYEKWYNQDQTTNEVKKLFSNPSVNAISIMLRGDLECIDIDQKNYFADSIKNHLFDDYKEYLDIDTRFSLEDMTIAFTKNSGYHILYRNKNASTSQKLASLDKIKETAKGKQVKPKTTIETRGTGSNLWVFPSDGYEFVNNSIVELKKVPFISDDERNWLISSAVTFGKESNALHGEIIEVVQKEKKVKETKEFDSTGLTCWDDYNQRATTDSLLDLIKSHGWTFVQEKTDRILVKHGNGTKARFSGCILKNTPVPCLYVWSSSTVFDERKCINAYSVYRILEHNGNYSDAAKELYSQGFGDRIATKETQQSEKKTEPIKEKISLALLDSVRFNYNDPIRNKKPVISFSWYEGTKKRVTDIVSTEEIFGVYGPAKSKKSRQLSLIQASAIGQKEIAGWSFTPEGKGVHFDTEQNQVRFQKLEHQKIIMADNKNFQSVYESFYLRKFSKSERKELVFDYLNENELAWTCIDGIVDLCTDYNSLEKSEQLIGDIIKICDQRKILLIGVLHIAPSSMKARGHLGTELMNKQDYGISLEPNKEDISKSFVKPYFPRGAGFPMFEIETNKYGFPYLFENSMDVLDERDKIWEKWNLEYERILGIDTSVPEALPIDVPVNSSVRIDRSNLSETMDDIPF